MAVRAGDAGNVIGGFQFDCGKGVLAGMAHLIGAGRQIVADGYTLIKNEAFAAPFTVLLGNGFKIVQNTPLQMVDFFKAFSLNEIGGFLTTNAAGAKHRYFGCSAFFLQAFAEGAKPFWELSKALRFRINRTFKCTDRIFIIIAGINQNRIRVADQSIPILRGDICAHARSRVDTGDTKCHDFLFQTYLQA